MLAAAITRVGIPCATPRPFCWRLNMHGTTTAGDTAASTNPSINPQASGNPNIRCDATATVTASTRHGMNANRTTPQDSFFKATGSRPKPARVRITTSAMFLQTNSFSYRLNRLTHRHKNIDGTINVQALLLWIHPNRHTHRH